MAEVRAKVDDKVSTATASSGGDAAGDSMRLALARETKMTLFTLASSWSAVLSDLATTGWLVAARAHVRSPRTRTSPRCTARCWAI